MEYMFFKSKIMVNVTKIEHILNATIHRYLSNPFNNLFNNVEHDKTKANKAFNLLLNVLHYTLNITIKYPCDNFDMRNCVKHNKLILYQQKIRMQH